MYRYPGVVRWVSPVVQINESLWRLPPSFESSSIPDLQIKKEVTGSQIRKPGDGRQSVKARVQSLDMSLVTVNWINRSMSHGRRVMSLPWDRCNTRVDSGMRLPRSHKGFILYPALPSPGHAVCGCPPFSIDTFLFCIAIVKCCKLALLSVSSRVKLQAKDWTRSSWRYEIRHRWV